MDLNLTGDQELLRDTAAKFIASTCPLTEVRQLAESDTGLPDDYLKQTAELGWYAMLIPEAHGGGTISGDGFSDLAVIAEERGRALQPGPFVTANAVAAGLAEWGSPDQQSELLGAIAAGQTVVSWAVSGPNGVWSPGESVTAVRDGDEFVLSGQRGTGPRRGARRVVVGDCRGPGGTDTVRRPDGRGGALPCVHRSHSTSPSGSPTWTSTA